MWFQKPPLGTPLDWGNPLNDETVLALAMNEGHGDKVQDLSLNGNHGTLNNFAFPPTATSGWNPGYKGVGLKFDGTGDFVSAGHNPTQDITDNITLSFLVYRYADTWSNVLGTSSGTTGYMLGVVTSNRVQLFFKSGTGGAAGEIKSAVNGGVPVGSWYNVVGTYDGAVMKTYINGVFQTSVNWVDTIDVTGLGVFVGCNTGAANCANASIDQPRIQSRAWSAKEVRDYAINPWQVYLDE